MKQQLVIASYLVAFGAAVTAASAQSSPQPSISPSSSPSMSAAMMKPTCKPGDAVVWVDSSKKTYYMQTNSMYGKTSSGKYLCESAASKAGDKMAPMTGSAPADGVPNPGPSSLKTNNQPNTVSSSSPSP